MTFREQPADASAGPNLLSSAWPIIGAVALIATAAVAAVVYLHHRTGRFRDEAVSLAAVSADSNTVQDALWAAIAPQSSAPRPDPAEAPSPSELERALSEFTSSRASPGHLSPAAQRTLNTYRSDIEEEISLLHQGDAGAAYLLAVQRTQLSYDAFEDAVGEDLAASARRADTYDLIAQFGSVFAIIASVTAAGWLFAHFHRKAEQAQFAAKEQAALRAGEEHYKHLVQYGSDIAFILRADGVFSFASPAVEHVLGWRPDEIEGHPALEFIHPDEAATVAARIAAFTEDAPGSRPPRVMHFMARDGSFRWIEVTGNNMTSDPRVGGFVLNVRDMTEWKAAQVEVAEARDRALDAARAKTAFLAMMSHEIRTPMNAIIGMTGLLLDTPLTHEQREFAEIVRSSGDSLLNLINDILDFSKVEAGKIDLEQIDFDLRHAVEDIGDSMAEPAAAHGLELLCEVDDRLPAGLRGDPGRLRQILTNLTANAIKFTDEGEVIVRALLSRRTPDGVLVRFEVTDTGPGIAPDVQQKLFDAFTQADSSTTRRFGGTGLGLAISRRLAELMGGEIGVTSELGNGSTFWFTVPFAEQSAQASKPWQVAAELRATRLLIVAAGATNRAILHAHAQAWSAHDESAPTGALGLVLLREAAARGEPFDVALVDHDLPDMDAAVFARAVHADDLVEGVRMVLMAPLGADTLEQRALFDATQAKPVRRSALYRTVVRALHRERDEDARPPTPAGADQVASPPQRARRILVAEDNIVNQKVALRILAKLGYSADAVANGTEALEALGRIPYDLVLMDCLMPVMDGYEATSAIRVNEGEERHTPIVAMTANAMHGDRERCLAAGMDDYLSKPVRPDDLADVIQRWLTAPAIDEREAA
jgi:PAS domain S-box-containing protein